MGELTGNWKFRYGFLHTGLQGFNSDSSTDVSIGNYTGDSFTINIPSLPACTANHIKDPAGAVKGFTFAVEDHSNFTPATRQIYAGAARYFTITTSDGKTHGFIVGAVIRGVHLGTHGGGDEDMGTFMAVKPG